jgi:hypothetical protein
MNSYYIYHRLHPLQASSSSSPIAPSSITPSPSSLTLSPVAIVIVVKSCRAITCRAVAIFIVVVVAHLARLRRTSHRCHLCCCRCRHCRRCIPLHHRPSRRRHRCCRCLCPSQSPSSSSPVAPSPIAPSPLLLSSSPVAVFVVIVSCGTVARCAITIIIVSLLIGSMKSYVRWGMVKRERGMRSFLQKNGVLELVL